MKALFKVLTVAFASSLATGVAQADEPYTKYLFAYFNGNSDAQENLFFAVADKDDPYNFTPLNGGKMVMDADTISLSGGLRDPHLYRGEDGWFYMVMTDMKSGNGWSSNRGLILLKSHDLVHWNHSTVHFPTKYAGTTFANAIYVWAPEVIYDSSVGKYLIHFALGTSDGNITYQKLYYAYANSDFTDLEGEPQYMYDRGSATIDMSIIYNETDGLYHGFYKNEGAGGICHATASSLTGAWTEVAAGVHQTNTAVEGSEIYRLIDSDTYVLMYDCYNINKMEYCTTTSAMTTFTKASTTANTEIFTPRHGSVIPITDAEYEALVNSTGNIYLASEISIAEAMGIDVASAKGVLNNASSTSSQLDEAYQSLKLAEEAALADYSEDMTSSLGSWTNDNVKDNNGQHWDGTNNSTYSENNSWGSQSWTMSMTQNVSLPAGKYVLRIPARGSSASSPQVSANGVISPVVTKGDTGFGITTAGVTSYSSGTFANNNNGRGWEWVYVPFTLNLSQEVPITISAISSGYHQWVSFDVNHLQLLYGGMTDELLEQSLAETIASGNALLDRPMNADARTQLIAAIAAAENAGANDDLEMIFSQLDAAYTVASVSADAYQALVDEIQMVTAKVEATPSSTGQSAYNSAMNVLTTEMIAGAFADDAIAGQVIRAKGILTHYLLADIVNSQQEEADITFLLQNPDFTTATQNGWTTTPAGQLNYECHEFYYTNFNIHQTLYGLPKGTYTLTTQAFYRSGSNADLLNPPLALNAKLYINNTTADIMSIVEGASAAENKSGNWVDYQNGTQTPNNMEAASYAFNTLSAYQPTETYNTVTVEVTDDDQNLELGAKKETTIANDWTIFNQFRLSFTPAPVEVNLGDVDANGAVDVSDVVAMINHIISNGQIVAANADLDGDSDVNVSDVVTLVNWIVSVDSGPGDEDPNPGDPNTVTIPEGEGSGPGIADVKMRF